jgi:hypothetical protein
MSFFLNLRFFVRVAAMVILPLIPQAELPGWLASLFLTGMTLRHPGITQD